MLRRGEEGSASSQEQTGIIIVGCTLNPHHIICGGNLFTVDQMHWELITYLTHSLVLVSCGIRCSSSRYPYVLDILTLGGISSFI